MIFPVILARGSARLIEGLFRGDPVAWVCLAVGIAVAIIGYYLRYAWSASPPPPNVYRPPLNPANRPDFTNLGGGIGPPPRDPNNPYS